MAKWNFLKNTINFFYDPSSPLAHNTHTQLLVNKADLEQLVTEAMMLKEFLPKVLTHDYLTSFSKLTQLDQGINLSLGMPATCLDRHHINFLHIDSQVT